MLALEFEKMDTFPFRNEQYFYYSSCMEELKNNFNAQRAKDYDLTSIFRNLESFYFLNKVKLMCESQSKIYFQEGDGRSFCRRDHFQFA
jgi:hypothetical protein